MPRTKSKVQRDCKQCGNQFFVLQSVLAKGQGVFCSSNCYLAYSGKSPARPMVHRECKQCGVSFTIRPRTADSGKGKFCSQKCWKEAPKPSPIITCGCCGKVFPDHGRNKRKYCSAKCYQAARPKSGKPPNRPHKHDKWALAVIMRDKQCVRCGVTESLQAHHLKPWKSYPELRYDVSNGVALCPLCHHAQHPKLPLERFVESGGKKVQYCVVCETAFLVRKKTQRVCSRKCGWERKKQRQPA